MHTTFKQVHISIQNLCPELGGISCNISTSLWGFFFFTYSLFAALFRDVPEMLDQIQIWSLAGSLKDIDKVVLKLFALISWLRAEGRCPAERWTVSPVWGPELWSRFSSRMPRYIPAFIFPLILTSLPVPAAKEDTTAWRRHDQASLWGQYWPGGKQCLLAINHPHQRFNSVFHERRDFGDSGSEGPLCGFLRSAVMCHSPRSSFCLATRPL